MKILATIFFLTGVVFGYLSIRSTTKDEKRADTLEKWCWVFLCASVLTGFMS